MIQARRALHRRVFGLLAIGIPLLLILSVAWRPELPPLESGGEALFAEAGFDRAAALPAGAEFALARAADDPRRVTIQPLETVLRPDLLVYWTAADAPTGDALPGDAVLVGSLAGTAARRLALPRAEGRLALYSLGHREVVRVLELPAP